MTAKIAHFARELDLLMAGRPTRGVDPALQAAAVLRSLDLDMEAAPSANLRARWLSRTQPAATLVRKPFLQALRARPLFAVLLALLILLGLSGVAYAFGRSFGYIPGYGIVDQKAAMRVLANPVSQTRDGITITIHEIILTADQLFATITTANIPNHLIVPMGDTTTITCRGDWVYELPDGSQLQPEQGSGYGMIEPLNSGDGRRISYQTRGYYRLSSPVNVNQISEMTLHIPCVTSDVPVGALPEHWEFQLQFIPAPANLLALTAFPVIEPTPSPIPTRLTPAPGNAVELTPTPVGEAMPSTVPMKAASSAEGSPISITQVMDAGDTYILIGEFASSAGLPDSSDPGDPDGWRSHRLDLVDANGRQVWWDLPMDIDLETAAGRNPDAQVWAVQFSKESAKALPVTIQYTEEQWKLVKVPLAFDAGDHPQPGDEWQVNQSFHVGRHVVTLTTVRIVPPVDGKKAGGYELHYNHLDPGIGVNFVDFSGYPSDLYIAGGGSSGESNPVTDRFDIIRGQFDPSLPKGRLTILVGYSVLDSEQTWTKSWQPGSPP